MTSRRLSRLRALLRSTACVLAVVGCALGATGCDPSTSSDAQSEAPSIESGPADLVDSSGSDSAGWTTGLALFSDTPVAHRHGVGACGDPARKVRGILRPQR